jgi:GntR family transcriptional regulator, transcriptional repressor for pyruvate dehydrogenase complex
VRGSLPIKESMGTNVNDIQFGTFQKDALSEKIVERLLDLIREKQLHPGDRLPPERELAPMMGVSRPSLREALRALSVMKVVENRQGSGTYITSLNPELFVNHLDFIFSVNDATFIDLFEARKIIEVGLVALAALAIKRDQFSRLEDCLERSAASVEQPDLFLQADLDLHTTIIEAANNRTLALFMKSITQINIASRQRTNEMPEVRRRVLRDHKAIVAALQKHDPEAAASAMRNHLAYVEDKLKSTSRDSRPSSDK